MKYLAPAQLDDELTATVRLVALKGASMRMQQTVQRAGQELARGDVTIACVDRAGVKPRRIPGQMLERLAPFTERSN